ncbi:MAG: hypothetical protein IT290_03805, partial [Deltaproteobacteria bacterium]|nr:hypothetical protein [Deltaproteobacteria bacterium]
MTSPTYSQSKNVPVTEEEARNAGIETPDWKRLLGQFGRQPNRLEVEMLLRSWAGDCSAREAQIFLRSVFRSAPSVVQESFGRTGAVDIGFGEAVVLSVASGAREGRLAYSEGVVASASLASREMAVLGARPHTMSYFSRSGSAESATTTRRLHEALRGSSRAARMLGSTLADEQIYFHARYENDAVVWCGLAGLVDRDSIPTVNAPTGNDLFVYLGEETVCAADSRGHARLIPDDPFRSSQLSYIVANLRVREMFRDIQPVGPGGLCHALMQFATRRRHGLRLHIDNVPLYRPGAPFDHVLFQESPGRYLALVPAEGFRRLNELLVRSGYIATQIGEVLQDRVVEVATQHRTVSSIPLTALVDETAVQSADLLLYPPMLYRGTSEEQQAPTS